VGTLDPNVPAKLGRSPMDFKHDSIPRIIPRSSIFPQIPDVQVGGFSALQSEKSHGILLCSQLLLDYHDIKYVCDVFS